LEFGSLVSTKIWDFCTKQYIKIWWKIRKFRLRSCNLNEIGNEYHFFLKCTANHSLRNNLFNKIILNKPDFIEKIPLNKIKFLLNANSELLAEVGDFIKQSTELQKWGPCRSKVWHVKNIMLVNRIYFVHPILWSNCNFLCFLCFACLYLYLLDPHGCIMQMKNYIIIIFA
jgi:hypothetical protein